MGPSIAHSSHVVDAPPPPSTGTGAQDSSALAWLRAQAQGGAPNGAGPEPTRSDRVPGRGQLGIKERRSWHTWQLTLVAVLAALLGMLIGNVFAGGGSSNSGAQTGGQTSGTLPPEGAGGTPAGSSTTTAPAGSTTTSTPATSAGSGTTTTAPATGPLVTLLGPHQASGNWTSTPFTVSGQWNIGWAYQCSPAPASGQSFEVFVVPAGGTAGAVPAVTETGASGNSVTVQSSAGNQELVVDSASTCIWVVKVTGRQ